MVERTEIDLKELRYRFNLVLDLAEEGFWEWDIEKGTVLHNKKWCEIFQVDESYLSHPIGDFIDFIHPDDREKVGQKIEKAIMQKGSYHAEDILYHHERMDGGGYPHGLRANKIPLGARVIAVADASESMTAERPYKNGKKSKEQAIKELKKNSGTQFDPKLVDLFIEKVLSNI